MVVECFNWKRGDSTDYVTKGLHTVTREMADDIPFRCFFHIIFRFGGQYGGNTPLLRRRAPSGMVQLFLMSWRLQQLSLKMETLKTVSVTFLSFMASYVLLLIAFALSFYILFRGSLQQDGTAMFSNPVLSLLKTFVILTGIFDAFSLYFDTVPYKSHMIFLLFVFWSRLFF